jgi:uncharacterized protein YjbJ (UPF0337 family)
MADKDRVEGSAKNMGGKLKEGLGNVTGDSKMKTEGKADQAEAKSRTPLAGSRIKPKKYLAARSNMTGGRVAPFFMPFHEVTFAVGHVGLDRAIEVGSGGSAFSAVMITLSQSPIRSSHRSRSLSVGVIYLMPLSLSTRNLRSTSTRHGLSAEEPVLERLRRQPLRSEPC